MQKANAAVTVTLTSLGTGGTNPTAGLAANPVYPPQTGIAIYGFSLTGTGTGTAKTVTSFSFQTNNNTTQNNNYFFSSISLYTSTTSTFMGLGAPQTGATPLATVTPGANGNPMVFTVPTISVSNGTNLYYFLVINYTGVAASNTFELDFYDNGGSANINTGAANRGFKYTFSPATLVEAQVTGGLTANPLNVAQSNVALFGMSLTSTNGNSLVTAIDFTTTTSLNNFTGSARLYESTSSSFPGVGSSTLVASKTITNTTTLNFTGLNETINNGTPMYYYVVMDNYTPPATSTTFGVNLNTNGIVTTNTTVTYDPDRTGTVYNLNAPSLAAAQITGGLAPTTLTTSQNNIAIDGISLTATGNNTFTSIKFTSTPAGGNISPNFTSVSLYSSTSSSFPGIGSATLLQTITSLASNSVTFTGLSETINDGVTKYYYLVVNYNQPASNATFQFNSPTITGATLTGTAAGQTYNLTAPSLTEASVTGGLAANPITGSQTNLAILGMSLTANSGNASFTALTFNATTNPAGGSIGTYFSGNVTLYSSTSSSFPGISDPSMTVLATKPAPATAAITFTVPTQTINNGTTVYYYVVMDANIPPAVSTTFQLSLGTVTGPNTTGSAAGPTYTMPAAVTFAAANNGLLANPLDHDQTGGVIGFSVTTTQSKTFTQFNLTYALSNGTFTTDFTGYQLYVNTTANTLVGASLVAGTPTYTPGANTLTITGLSQTIPTTTYYYFLVVTYKAPPTSATFTASIASGVAGGITYANGAPQAGPTYTLTPPITFAAASTAGQAANPLNYSQTGIALFGFSANITQSETFSQFNLTYSLSNGTFTTDFPTGTYKLYVNTSNTFVGATQVTGTPAFAPGAGTFTISGLTQTYTAGTYYFYVVANFNDPSTAGTFQFSLTNGVAAAVTYASGAPIAGTTYNIGPATNNWVGGSGGNDWNVPANWSYGVVPLPADKVQIGVATYTAGNDPVIATADPSITVSSITFGSNNSTNTIKLTVNGSLTTTGDITIQSDNNSDNQTYTVSGTGTINAVNFNLITNTEHTSNNITATVNCSVKTVNLSGNLYLQSDEYDDFNFPFIHYDNPTFNITGGTVNLTGQIKTYNSDGITQGETSTVSVTNATLNLANAAALSMDSGGVNKISFDNTGSFVNFTGASPIIYTSTANHVSGGVKYQNLTISGTGNAVPGGGTLTIDKDLVTSAAVNFATNTPNVNIAGNWTNTANIAQGGSAIAISGVLQNNANTITGGSGALTAGSMQFNGGNLIASTGQVQCTGTYQNNGGAFTCSSGNVIFKGTYQNNAGTFTAGTGMVYFSGASQTLVDNTAAGTLFNNVTFNGTGTTSMTAGVGNFGVSAAGTLTMGTGSKLTAGNTSTTALLSYLTLYSNAASTATVATIPGTASITGNVNVQRYVTGNSNPIFRCYRLFSSPVNASGSTTGGGIIDLSYLNKDAGGLNAITTAGPGSGFTTYNANPLIYLYDVTRATNNRVFVGGKDVGVTAIAGASTYSLHLSVLAGVDTSTNAVLPVGNSWLLYYVGNTSNTGITTTAHPAPENATATAVGTLNQGNITVNFWKYTGTGSTTIPYSVGHGDAASVAGLNQVGNPYASTIDLVHVYSDNSPIISNVFYELDDQQGTYVSYTSGMISSTRASRYIVSGQGFLINALAAGETGFKFTEADKVSYPAITYATTVSGGAPGTLLMDMPTTPTVGNADIVAAASLSAQTPPKDTTTLVGLHLQLALDSTANTQTGIYFNNQWNDNYTLNHDALDLDGTSPKVYFSSYSADGKRLCINGLGSYAKGKRIKLYAGANSSGVFNISLVDIHNIDTNMYNVYLVDNKMKDSLDMVKYRSYSFNINNSDTTSYGANRFVLAIELRSMPPYKLVNFSGQKVNNGVQLNWITLNEGTYTTFALQKRLGDYTTIYTTQGTGAGLYSFVDQHPVTGNNTYRLQQTDIYGNVTYSSPVTVNYNNKLPANGITIYPNPSRSIINISLNSNTWLQSSYIVDIYNSSGNVVEHKTVTSSSFTEDVSSYNLGVYVVDIKTSNGLLIGQSKFIKVN